MERKEQPHVQKNSFSTARHPAIDRMHISLGPGRFPKTGAAPGIGQKSGRAAGYPPEPVRTYFGDHAGLFQGIEKSQPDLLAPVPLVCPRGPAGRRIRRDQGRDRPDDEANRGFFFGQNHP